MQKVNENKGFTLVEVLAVVAIIAVLAAIAIPTFAKQIAEAKVGADISELSTRYHQAVADAMFESSTGTITQVTMAIPDDLKNGSTVTLDTDGTKFTVENGDASKVFEVPMKVVTPSA